MPLQAWNCSSPFSLKSTGSDSYVLGNLTGVDYQTGFTGLGSCQGKCDGEYKAGGAGCLALEYHAADKHCVLYSGPGPLAAAAFSEALTPTASYTACMLVDKVLEEEEEEEEEGEVGDSRRRLEAAAATAKPRDAGAGAAAAAAVPQHCGSVKGAPKQCFGDGARADSKQRNKIELLSRLTRTPEPDLDSMDWNGADRWLASRWREWKAQGGPVH